MGHVSNPQGEIMPLTFQDYYIANLINSEPKEWPLHEKTEGHAFLPSRADIHAWEQRELLPQFDTQSLQDVAFLLSFPASSEVFIQGIASSVTPIEKNHTSPLQHVHDFVIESPRLERPVVVDVIDERYNKYSLEYVLWLVDSLSMQIQQKQIDLDYQFIFQETLNAVEIENVRKLYKFKLFNLHQQPDPPSHPITIQEYLRAKSPPEDLNFRVDIPASNQSLNEIFKLWVMIANQNVTCDLSAPLTPDTVLRFHKNMLQT